MEKKKVSDYIEKQGMICPGDAVIAAVSGGADSVALLLLLSEFREEMGFSLLAVHVEHGIRGEESLRDMYFTKSLCEEKGIPLRIYHVDAPAFAKEHGAGLEEAARMLRYDALEEAADAMRGILKTDSVKIALAHHLQDQAETVLFRLIRGSGIHGLSGMQPVRQCDGADLWHTPQSCVSKTAAARQKGRRYTFIRPLLAVSRGEIEEYLAACGQDYRVDSTNLDEGYARNRIRNRVLPELSEVNTQAAAHIAQAAEQAAETADYMEKQASGELQRILEVESAHRVSMEISELSALHPALQKEVLRKALILVAGHEKDLEALHVRKLAELAEKTSGKEISLPYQVKARREFDRLVLVREQAESDGGRSDKDLPPEDTELRVSCEETSAEDADQTVRAEAPEKEETGISDGIEITAEQLESLKETGETLRIRLAPKEEILLTVRKVFRPEEAAEAEEGKGGISGNAGEKCFDFEELKDGFRIRHREPGDFFRMKDGHRKKLKQHLIEKKIPASERKNLWLFARGSQVLWLVDGRADPSARPDANTEYVLCAEAAAVIPDDDSKAAGEIRMEKKS